MLHFLLLLALIAGGCSSFSRRTNAAKASEPVPGPPRLSPREFEERVEALAHFATGVHLELEGDATNATKEYYKAALGDPENEALALDVARRLIREQKPEEAITLLEKRLNLEDPSGAVHGMLALAYHQSGDTDRAIEMGRRTIEKAPHNLTAYQHLSQLYLQAGRTNDVLELMHQATSQPEAPVEFQLGLAELLARFQLQNVIESELARPRIMEALDRAAAGQPENPLFRQRLADFYMMYGEMAKAEPLYVELLKDFPDAPGVRERLANIYLRLEKNQEAAALLEEMARDKPTDPQNYYFLGSLAFDGEDFPKAAEYYETAIKLNPDFEPVYYDLAGVNIARQNPREALAVLEAARLRFKQLNFTLEFYTGVAHSQMEKYSEALPHLVSAELLAKTTDPSRLNHVFYYQLGSTHERIGNISEAVKAFRKALEISPDYAEAMNYLGYMWAERGEKLDEAKELIERAVELEPENAAFLDSLAWVLHQLKDSERALPYMHRAIELSEEPDPTLYDHLGDIHLALGQSEQARDAYEKALAAKPDEGIRKKLDQLEEAGTGSRAGQSRSRPE